MKIVVVSGGFDPIHSGHIAYFKSAKKLGDKLIVALNSDKWLINKKGKFFMPFEERSIIIKNLAMVDEVIDFEDDEFGSASHALIKIKESSQITKLSFATVEIEPNKTFPRCKLKISISSLVLVARTKKIHRVGF